MKILLIVLSIFFSITVFADVPHTLVDGNVVDASQLNENFSYLDGEKYTVRTNGVIIGTVDNWDLYSSLKVRIKPTFETVSFNKDGTINNPPAINVYYKSASCQGDLYERCVNLGASTTNFTVSPQLGRIYIINSQVYYYPKNAQVYKITIQSDHSVSNDGTSGTCSDSTQTNIHCIKLLPNDPAVTGIQAYPFPTPITIDGVNASVIDSP